jgi:CubicO group peptidase (beta-lactamase class C family)
MDKIEERVREAAAGLTIPGFVAAATRDGETLYDFAVGQRPDAVFWIASMTKAITAVAAMQLVEQGKIGLDEPLGPILPLLAKVQVLDGFGPDETPILRAPKRPVTLAHLLTHTSGYAYAMWNADVGRYCAKTGLPDMGSGLDAALELPLMFDPGERWEYGIGIDVAGKVVEALSGQTLDAYFAEHIFAPLGMTDTSFRPTASMRERLAGMSMRTPDGALAPIDFALSAEPEFWGGGGGLYSTASDYLVFLNALLNDGAGKHGRILDGETITRMAAHRIGPVPLRRLTSAMPFLTHDLDLGFDGADWALSFQVNPEAGKHGRAAGSLAWAGLANTYYWADPTHRVAGVLMTQLLPFADPQVLSLFEAFERAVYDV